MSEITNQSVNLVFSELLVHQRLVVVSLMHNPKHFTWGKIDTMCTESKEYF
jgi:hypothetical protein